MKTYTFKSNLMIGMNMDEKLYNWIEKVGHLVKINVFLKTESFTIVIYQIRRIEIV